jgi:hypothetical protein
MSSKRQSSLTRAIHEAGHAVAAIMLSIRFDEVTIEPLESGEGGSVRGFAQYTPNYVSDPETKDEPESLAFWQNLMVVCLAGPAANRRCQCANWRGYAVGDLQEVLRLINDIHRHSEKKVRETYYKFLEALASELVEKFWPRVEALATALVERRTLTHAEACFIVTGYPWKPIKLRARSRSA